MCGIFTVINNRKLNYKINDFLSAIEHRGPDDFGWVDWNNGVPTFGKEDSMLKGEVIQGHTRLSILDLSDLGWQPMRSDCGKYTLSYNGEIYNFIELREELKALGYSFKSESDSEVLLYGLIEWKEALLPKLRGMFAFTFFDSANAELIIARDFFGIKPLFYSQIDSDIAFSSEVQQLLLCEGVSAGSNAQSVYDYLVAGATEHSANSTFKDIKIFPPASYAKYKLGHSKPIEIIKYWELNYTKRINPTFEEAVKKVRELFLDSVRLHMRSDVPVGAALSGGIDSSAIVCAIRHINPNQEIHSFSFIADDEKLSEEKWVDIVNDHVGAHAHKIKATKNELIEDLDDLINTQREPFGSTSIYAQYRVFKQARSSGITVMLDGQGADEMLAGYITYQSTLLSHYIKKGRLVKAYRFYKNCVANTSNNQSSLLQNTFHALVPSTFGKLIKRLFLKNKRVNWLSNKWLADNNVNDNGSIKRVKDISSPLHGHLKSSLCDFGIPHLLRYEDRNSMRWSIESRVPFLHVDLVEYLFSLPEEFLLNEDAKSKYIFREAMRGIVPDSILDRKDKIGFATPEKKWLTQMDSWVQEQLQNSKKMPMFNHEELKKEWDRVVTGKTAFDFRCWRWLNLIKWLNQNEK